MNQEATKFEPREVSDVMMAFPASVIPDYLPPEKEIPEEYWDRSDSWHHRLMNDMFFSGVKKLQLYPREGVNPAMAFRHIQAVMRSFQPKHEHKEAGVKYLLDSWFEGAQWEKGNG